MLRSGERAARPRTRRRRGLRVLHRWVGIGAALFLLLLALTGVLLNHSASLGLDRRSLAWPWLLEHYGIAGPTAITSFAAAGRRVSFADGRLYLDRAFVSLAIDELRGAVAIADKIAVASSDEILLLDPSGDVIDRNAVGLYLPGPIDAVAAGDGLVWLQSSGMVFEYELASGIVTRAPADDASPMWVRASAVPEENRSTIERDYRGAGLSAERVLADLHSGRLVGVSGVIVMDLAAIALGALAVSGALLWLRR
jgi:hypothetical protein